MTDYNKHNPYPYIATIRCPRCGKAAEFRKAFALIQGKAWGWWEPRLWPSASLTDWDGKERWYPGDPAPAWRSWIVIEQDPSIHRWKKPPRGGYSATDEGVIACLNCVGRRKHVLDWPADAFYRFELTQGVLWAWNRELAQALIDFIGSTRRDPAAYGPHFLFLSHIPKRFLLAKEREATVKLLDRALQKLKE